MTIDGFAHQLPDIDPEETTEWLESLDAVAEQRGKARAQYLVSRLIQRESWKGWISTFRSRLRSWDLCSSCCCWALKWERRET
jgi:hypothetical protein